MVLVGVDVDVVPNGLKFNGEGCCELLVGKTKEKGVVSSGFTEGLV